VSNQNEVNAIVAALIAAGVAPAEAAKAAAEAVGAADTSAPQKVAATPSWEAAVITAAEGFMNDKGKRVDTCVPGTVTISDGDEKAGTVYGRDARDEENVRLRVSSYRRNKDGQYRVRTIATATHGDLATWSEWIDALGTAPAPTKAAGSTGSMSKRDMLRAAKAAGVKIDGRKSEENVRAEFVAAGLA